MVIAPNFIFVHLSKTGGTFAADNIREVLCPTRYGRKLHRLRTRQGLRVRLPFYKYRYDERYMHAFCNDIPEAHRHKTIVSCIRNPFDLYVSEYTYKWWQDHPRRWFHDLEEVERVHPHWRESSFDEFMALSNRYAEWVCKALAKYPQTKALGWYSHKFIYYYCRDHDYVFEAAGDFELLLKRVKERIYPVRFLHTQNLNQELFDFLLERGYAKEQIEFILQKEKVKTSRTNYDYRNWYGDVLKREIETKDALLFSLFPEFQF